MSDQNNDENKGKVEVDATFVEDYAATKEALNNVVEELKDLRKSNSTKNEEIEALKKKVETGGGSDDESAKLEKLLEDRDKKERTKNFDQAIEEFKNANSVFNPSNDTGGLKFKAFEKELSKFNLSNLSSKEEFSSRLKEVHSFMNRGVKKEDDTVTVYAETRKSPSNAAALDETSLTDKERKLIRTNNLDLQSYLKMKEKRPAYVNALLKFVE